MDGSHRPHDDRHLAELVGDLRFDDPYRRLEDDSPGVRAWEARLDAEARAHLTSLPQAAAITAAVRRHLAACATSAPVRRHGRWFSLRTCVDGGESVLEVSDAPGRPGRKIVRADDLASGPNAGIDWFAPSPDGAWVAVGASTSGDEQSVLNLVDVASGRVAAPRISHASGGAVAWLPSSRGLYCLAGRVPDTHSLRKDLLFVEPGSTPERIALPSAAPASRQSLQVSPDGRHLGLVAHPAAPRLTDLFDRGAGDWSAVTPIDAHATLCGSFHGDRYYAVTTAGADRGRLVSGAIADLTKDDPWEEAVAETENVLRAVAPVGDLLLLAYFAAGASVLRLVTDRGRPVGTVPLPATGLVSTSARTPGQYGSVPPVHADAEGLTFSFSTINAAPVLARFDVDSRQTHLLDRPAATLDSVQAEVLSCRSPGGVDVRYQLLRPAASRAPRPTLIVAYGGWNAMSAASGYPAQLAPLLEAGGNVVLAHVRGDATFGARQWHDGRRRRKQSSFDDVCAIADDLLARGVAHPGRLGICGASNGGLLVGAALVQRPELFRVAVAVVPLLDMCRFVRERFGEHAAWEYGDPREPEDAAVLRRYSPYHNVRGGERYPATLIVCADGDTRTASWHGRKMVAALRSATAGTAPILLRVHQDRGHRTTSDLAPAWLVGEWLAFAISELGLGLGLPTIG